MSEQEAQDKARAEAEKRWPPSPYAAHYEEPLLESSCRVAFVAGAAWERSRVVEAAPSDTDREALTDEALWDFAHDLLDVWNVEDLNPPSLVEQFRDQFVARFGASQPVQVEVTDDNFGGHSAIALGIEDGLREVGGELHGCTPSMLVLPIQKRIAAERSLTRGCDALGGGEQ